MIKLVNNNSMKWKENNRAAAWCLQVNFRWNIRSTQLPFSGFLKAKTVCSGYNYTVSVCPHLSDKRKGQMSGTGGVAGRSLASAMMCSKVMSVCVHTSATHTSWGAPLWLCATAAVALVGVRRRTCTTMGSRLMASTTASSWSTLEKSRPFTWRNVRAKSHFTLRSEPPLGNNPTNHMLSSIILLGRMQIILITPIIPKTRQVSCLRKLEAREWKVQGDLTHIVKIKAPYLNPDLTQDDWQSCVLLSATTCFTFTPGSLTIPLTVSTVGRRIVSSKATTS